MTVATRRRTDYGAAANRKVATPAPVTAQVRTKPYRITVDLDPALYEQVKDGVRRVAADVGRDVPLAVVARALFEQWLTDPALAEQLRADLRAALRY